MCITQPVTRNCAASLEFGEVHYNSWYDFYSYQELQDMALHARCGMLLQDEGFNGGFKDCSFSATMRSERPSSLSRIRGPTRL